MRRDSDHGQNTRQTRRRLPLQHVQDLGRRPAFGRRLLINSGLLDVVSRVPPETIGRSNIYISSVGEATLVLEIRDSMSGAIFARAVDRRAAEREAWLMDSNRVTNRAEVRRLARAWGRRLRQGLERLMTEGI